MANLKDLAEGIMASHENRARVIQAIAKNTQRLTEDFRQQREQMSKELKELLAKSQSLRRADFSKMMEEIISARQKREEEVGEMLVNFKTEQVEIAERLRELLGRGESIKLVDFKKTLAGIKKDLMEKDAKNTTEQIRTELAQMKEELYGLVGNLKKEIEK